MQKPLISVNLLLYKPKFYLEPCLKSLLAQSYDNWELLIIDNASGDGTVERVNQILSAAEGKTPFHKVVANSKNLGFAAGHNQGIKASRGELVVMVNQDLILDKDFLSNIVEIFADERIGAAQGKLRRLKVEGEELTKTDIIDNAGLIFLKNRRIVARGQGQLDKGQFDEPTEIFVVDGALPIYRRAALEDTAITFAGQTEYFDEDFFAYKEDVDLGWRLRLYGWRAWYAPQALAWHARTSGESLATNYFTIIRERLKISKLGKYHSFKNQRLMQIKNELPRLLLAHAPWWLPKEIGAWLYALVFERYTWKSMKELWQLAPRAWQKRQFIMAQRKVGAKEIGKWYAGRWFK